MAQNVNNRFLNQAFPTGGGRSDPDGNGYESSAGYRQFNSQLRSIGMTNPQFGLQYIQLSPAEQVPLTRVAVRAWSRDPQNGLRTMFDGIKEDGDMSRIGGLIRDKNTSAAANIMNEHVPPARNAPAPAARPAAAPAPAQPAAAAAAPAERPARAPRASAEPRAPRAAAAAAPAEPPAPTAEEVEAQRVAAQQQQVTAARETAGQSFDAMFKGENPAINEVLAGIANDPNHPMYNYRDQLQRFANEAATDPAMRTAYMDAGAAGNPPGSNMENNLGTFMNMMNGQMPEGSGEITPEQMDMVMRDMGENPRAYIGMLGSEDMMGAIKGRGMMQGIGNMIGIDFGNLMNGMGGMMGQLGDWLKNLFSADGPLGKMFGSGSPFGSLFGQSNEGPTAENPVTAQTNAPAGTSLAREAGFVANDNSQTLDANGRERAPETATPAPAQPTIDLDELARSPAPAAPIAG